MEVFENSRFFFLYTIQKMTCFRESNWTVAKKTDAFYRLEHHWWEQRALVKLVSFFLLSIWGNELKAQQFTLLYQINVSELVTEFCEKTLTKVLWLFLISENYFDLWTLIPGPLYKVKPGIKVHKSKYYLLIKNNYRTLVKVFLQKIDNS